jgi:hypothetical protein
MKKRLIAEKRHAIRTAHAGGLEKGDDIGKDLLSILSEYLVTNTALRILISSSGEYGYRPPT